MTLRLFILILTLFCYENVAYREIKAGIFDLVKFPVSMLLTCETLLRFMYLRVYFYSVEFRFNQRIYICRMTFAVAKGIEMELVIPGRF